MATLLDQRQERLHRQFLDAADRFPFVRLLAARRLEEPGTPGVGERAAMGVELRGLLKQDRDCSQIVDSALVSIEWKAWQAAVYLIHGEYEGREDLHAQVDAAIRDMRRLSEMAASCFGVRDIALEPKSRWDIAWEWGQAVLRMAFLREEWVMNPFPGFLVREPKEDWFTAGARAVEILAAAAPAAPGEPQAAQLPPAEDRGNENAIPPGGVEHAGSPSPEPNPAPGDVVALGKPHAVPTAEPGGTGNDPGEFTPEARAILFIHERLKTTGKVPTKTAIAEALGVSRRTLNNWFAFKVAFRQLQSKSRRQPARGSKDKDGTLEAWREDGE